MYTEAQRVACKRYYDKHKDRCLARNRDWRESHVDQRAAYKRRYNELHKEHENTRNPDRKRSIKQEVFVHYGATCDCCGEKSHEFLCIDHRNGGGVKHRKRENLRGGTEFYAWLKRKGFPKGFRVLCHKKDAKLSSCKGDRIVVRVTATYEVEE